MESQIKSDDAQKQCLMYAPKPVEKQVHILVIEVFQNTDEGCSPDRVCHSPWSCAQHGLTWSFFQGSAISRQGHCKTNFLYLLELWSDTYSKQYHYIRGLHYVDSVVCIWMRHILFLKLWSFMIRVHHFVTAAVVVQALWKETWFALTRDGLHLQVHLKGNTKKWINIKSMSCRFTWPSEIFHDFLI